MCGETDLRHFLVFRATPHTTVDFLRASSMPDALTKYVEATDRDARVRSDRRVEVVRGRSARSYAHPLAYIEAVWKCECEWTIREVPQAVWEAPCANAFCGENPGHVAEAISGVRPLLRLQFPHCRAPAFVWYLKSGVLVTYYRRLGRDQIGVVARYLCRPDGEVAEWCGGYADIEQDLWGPQPCVPGLW